MLLPLLLMGQPYKDALRDSKWVFGYSIDDSTSVSGNMLIDFLADTMQISTLYTDMNIMETNASICDTLGALLFYTNGAEVRDRSHSLMAGWDTLNPGLTVEEFFEYGYRPPQGTLILPQPGNDSLYYLFHSSYNYFTQFPEIVIGDYLYYTLIDMHGNSGLGEIIDLNHVIVDDLLDYGKISACRHANGRDWWVIMHKFESPSHYIFLLDPQGVHNMGIVSGTTTITKGLGQGVFSPDGSKYALMQAYNVELGNFVYIYNFDRCTGVLEEIAYDNIIDTAYCGGAAISPNSRYLFIFLRGVIPINTTFGQPT